MTDSQNPGPANPVAPTVFSQTKERSFLIDFIDPLFAVVIHIGFVEGLSHQKWLHARSIPSSTEDWANLLLFVAGFLTIVLSWVGYHKSIKKRPIEGDMRFILDVVLLVL